MNRRRIHTKPSCQTTQQMMTKKCLWLRRLVLLLPSSEEREKCLQEKLLSGFALFFLCFSRCVPCLLFVSASLFLPLFSRSRDFEGRGTLNCLPRMRYRSFLCPTLLPEMADSKSFWFLSSIFLWLMVPVPLSLCSQQDVIQNNNFTNIFRHHLFTNHHDQHHHISPRNGVRRIFRRDGKFDDCHVCIYVSCVVSSSLVSSLDLSLHPSIFFALKLVWLFFVSNPTPLSLSLFMLFSLMSLSVCLSSHEKSTVSSRISLLVLFLSMASFPLGLPHLYLDPCVVFFSFSSWSTILFLTAFCQTDILWICQNQ